MDRELVVATLMWEPNETSFPTSRCYTEEYPLKLQRGFARHLTIPHRFVLFTDRRRSLPSSIEQVVEPDLGLGGYGDCIRPFKLDAPMILAGLDTLVVGSCDKFARWCLDNPRRMALPKHPYEDVSINGVVFCGKGLKSSIFDPHRGENDMEWLRQFPHDRTDELWAEKVISYKAHVRPKKKLPTKARIVYFHGSPKMEAALGDPIVKTNWI